MGTAYLIIDRDELSMLSPELPELSQYYFGKIRKFIEHSYRCN